MRIIRVRRRRRSLLWDWPWGSDLERLLIVVAGHADELSRQQGFQRALDHKRQALDCHLVQAMVQANAPNEHALCGSVCDVQGDIVVRRSVDPQAGEDLLHGEMTLRNTVWVHGRHSLKLRRDCDEGQRLGQRFRECREGAIAARNHYLHLAPCRRHGKKRPPAQYAGREEQDEDAQPGRQSSTNNTRSESGPGHKWIG